MLHRVAFAFAACLLAALPVACNTSRDDGPTRPAVFAPDSASAHATAPGTPASLAGPPRLRLLWDGLDQPVAAVSPPRDSRVFVVEKRGTVRVAGAVDKPISGTPYLDVSGEVSTGSEQGLLGLAFHPGFAENGRLYLNFTDEDGDTHIREVTVDPAGGAPATVRSSRDLLRIEQPFPNHNGGHLAFGPDGLLYIGTGDGGGANDPRANAQNPNSLLGKMLRLNVDAAEPQPEMWARGLRNPWRYSFDRETGDLWIADVGQDAAEEVNVLRAPLEAGGNFGWPAFEGDRRNRGVAIADPIPSALTYSHEHGCAITGGFVYRGAVEALQGRYVFGDACSGRIWTTSAADPGETDDLTRDLGSNGLSISSFGETSSGDLLVVDLKGNIYMVTAG
jgi:glucose/arabinose dehydrogenase